MIFSIILSILKIIGIVLLCILGILLFCVLVILFVPIRYKIMADANIDKMNKDYHIVVSVSWLLYFIRGKYIVPSEEGFVVKIGPFSLNNRKAKKSKEKKQKNKKKEKKAVSQETVEKKTEPDISDEAKSYESKKESIIPKRKGLKEKILYTWKKNCDRMKKILEKLRDIFKNIKKYQDVLKSQEFKEAFSLCKKSFTRLFCMIKPKKVKVKGKAGFENPEYTGYMCAVVGILAPYFHTLCITPDFENYVVDGKALIKGKVYLVVVLFVGVKVYFDKNIRKVLDMF